MREPHEFEAPLCAEVGGNYWFPEDLLAEAAMQATKAAKSICASCEHQSECAEWGINNERYGIWGGLTSVTLRTIRKNRNIIKQHKKKEQQQIYLNHYKLKLKRRNKNQIQIKEKQC